MRVSGWRAFVAALLAVTVLSNASTAQDSAGAALATEAVKYLPEESIGTVTLWPARTAKLPRFRLAPLEVASAAGLEQVGIDPLTIQRVDVMLPIPNPAGVQFGAVIQAIYYASHTLPNPQWS